MKRFIYLLFFITTLIHSNIHAHTSKLPHEFNHGPDCILNFEINSGFFAMFAGVLGALKLYERGNFTGITVNLGKNLYYDPMRAPNWLENYFEPINYGSGSRIYKNTDEEAVKCAWIGFSLDRLDASKIIKKYIHLKPSLTSKVNAYVADNFKKRYVIGVHHRGTDKAIETEIITYETTLNKLRKVIEKLRPSQKKNFCIYIATDEQSFLDYVCMHYPNEVVFSDFVRSDNGLPLHMGQPFYTSNYQKGEEALLDCILLSKCNVLIRPNRSCLSLVSTYYNPNMKVYSLGP